MSKGRSERVVVSDSVPVGVVSGTRSYKGGRRVSSDGTIKVACWCEKSYVQVPVEKIGISTESCGHPECKPQS